jgi:pyridoxine/pyridoxamine 5'-phosphate oxidase
MANYKNMAFVLIKPPATVVSTKKINSQNEHDILVQKALDKGLLLYYAKIEKRKGIEFAKQPWCLVESSIPKDGVKVTRRKVKISTETDSDFKSEIDNSKNIFCPYCKKILGSTSGRTLHVKSEHPDKYQEYLKNK